MIHPVIQQALSHGLCAARAIENEIMSELPDAVALLNDKARLDWLEQQELNRMIEAELIGPDGKKDFLVLAEDGTTCWGKTYREALDAAMDWGNP